MAVTDVTGSAHLYRLVTGACDGSVTDSNPIRHSFRSWNRHVKRGAVTDVMDVMVFSHLLHMRVIDTDRGHCHYARTCDKKQKPSHPSRGQQ